MCWAVAVRGLPPFLLGVVAENGYLFLVFVGYHGHNSSGRVAGVSERSGPSGRK